MRNGVAIQPDREDRGQHRGVRENLECSVGHAEFNMRDKQLNKRCPVTTWRHYLGLRERPGPGVESGDLSAHAMIFKGLRMAESTRGVSRDGERSVHTQRPERGGGTGRGE